MIENEIEVIELDSEKIESMIYYVRGQKVMLDFELAEIYGYETKRFNQQVKNNIDKFDDDFRFQLTKEEYDYLARSKNLTSRIWTDGNKGGRTYLQYAFTEQGVYMLMTILKGELAIKQSKALIRIFKSMKDYIIENKELLNNNANILKIVNSNTKRIESIESVINNFSIDSKKHYLILNGEKIEADIAYQEIYKTAIESIYIIDDYIDIKTLQLLKCINNDIEVTIFSDNKSRNNLNENFINDFINDTGINIKLKKNNDKFHDRYIIVDFNTENECIYHSGASSKDAGKRITTILKIEENNLYKNIVLEILFYMMGCKNYTSNGLNIMKALNLNGIPNSQIVSFGRRIIELKGIPEQKSDNNQNRYWNIPFTSDFSKNKKNLFTWKIRDELAEALIEK